MSTFPESSLIAAGFLRRRCCEPVNMECPACGTTLLGLSVSDCANGVECGTCGQQSPQPRLKCARCKQSLPFTAAGSERDCLSIQAYLKGDSVPAFAPEEALWAFKRTARGSVKMATESELRRWFGSAELDATVLVRSMSQEVFVKAEACPEFQDVARPCRPESPIRPPPRHSPELMSTTEDSVSPASGSSPSPSAAPTPSVHSVKAAKGPRIMVAMLALAAIATAFWYIWIEKPEQKRQAEELAEEQNHWLARGISKETPFVNTLGMKFVPVPGTKILFSIWDARVQDFKTYFRANNNKSEWWEWRNADGFAIGDTHPVVYVTWNDAQDFCKWLTDKERNEGKMSQSQSYRLPMDWEWSVAVGLHERRSAAASAKDEKNEGVYPWGNQWPPPNDAGNYDGFSHTTPVGNFKANQFGLYDMGGNVFQMCQDELYSGEYVVRGGSWKSGDAPRVGSLLSSHRGMTPPDDRSEEVGFRCVLVDESYR